MTEPIMQFFSSEHLPARLRDVSLPFQTLASGLLGLPRSAERTVALRKLLESKDAAVRAALFVEPASNVTPIGVKPAAVEVEVEPAAVEPAAAEVEPAAASDEQLQLRPPAIPPGFTL